MTALVGQVVAITGAARGIGYATAKVFIERGAVVAVSDVDEEALAIAAEELGAAHHAPLDVSDGAAFATFLASVESTLGPLGVLVNNAGIMPSGPLLDQSDRLARKAFEINVLGVIHGTTGALSLMVPRRSGHIVNVCSTMGEAQVPGLSTYNATKAAAIMFTDAARLEFRESGVHISAILPGGVNTDLLKIHHALMDGVTGATRLTLTLTPDPADISALALWSVGPARHVAPRRSTSWTASLRDGVGTLSGLRKAGVSMARDRRSAEPDLAVPFVAPRTVLNGRIGEQRRVATQTYELDRLKAIANSQGVSLNDVFLAISAGSIRRYLNELDALPEQSLTAGTPVSVRVQGDAGSTNAFTMTVMKLATDIEDPVERLDAIARSSAAAKQNLAGMSKGVLANYASLFMGPFIAANRVGIAGRTTPPYNIVVSNVPGPTDLAYWAEGRLDSMAPVAIPYHGVGLYIAALTVSEKFCVGLVGDRDRIPHLQRIAVYMGDALTELETAVGLPIRSRRDPGPAHVRGPAMIVVEEE